MRVEECRALPFAESQRRRVVQLAQAARARQPRREVEVRGQVPDHVCLFGSTLPWTRIVRNVALVEAGKPVAAIWGHGARTSLCQAVLVNSTAGHAFEMNDIHKESRPPQQPSRARGAGAG